nr:hypothetical protein [Tanacetum cinerariifolium]
LALMYGRIFLEESDEVEKYVGGLLAMIQGSKIRTFAERLGENKRKFDNDNHAHQQPPKKKNIARAYSVGSSKKKEYAETLPLCNKCKFHHNGPCTVKTSQVWSHRQNSEEAGVSKDMLVLSYYLRPNATVPKDNPTKQAKMKATPRKLAYADSGKEAPARIFATKKVAKDPTELHGIKKRQNEGLQAFMDWFKSESSHIKGVASVLCISACMHGHDHPELAKKLNDKIPKTVDEMFERVRAFIRGEVVVGSVKMDTFTPITKTPKEIMAMESVSFLEPPPLIGTLKKQSLNKFCDYHRDRGHNTNDCYQLKKQIEEVVALGKLAHLVKDIRQTNQRNESLGRNNVKVINMIREEGSHKRPFKKGRPGLMNELAFPAISRSQLTEEPIILDGIIEGSLKAIRECKHLEKVQGTWKEIQWRQRKEQISKIQEQVILRTKNNSRRGPDSGLVSPKKHRAEKTQRRKQGSIRMGQIRKDSCSTSCHEASAKDISACRANGPQEVTHGIRKKTSIEGKGILVAKGRINLEGSTPRMDRQHDTF